MGTLKWPGDSFIFFLHREVHLSQNGIYGDCKLFYVFQTGQNHCWPSYQNLAETIEKPLMSMVNQQKNIQWWWFSGSKTIEQPLIATQKKSLPSHRCEKITIVEVYYPLSGPIILHSPASTVEQNLKTLKPFWNFLKLNVSCTFKQTLIFFTRMKASKMR